MIVQRDDLVPNQWDPSLPTAVQEAACGPAAAVAFARALGRDPSLAEVVELARWLGGWTEAGGMNGLENMMKLLEAMEIPASLDWTADWGRVTGAAGAGRPVIISTWGHYFVADRYDVETGTFHVGNSGSPALKAGGKWMSLWEMERLEGTVQAAIYLEV